MKSALAGIGGGLSTTPGIILVSQYFDKHRALANGICVSGTAAGSFVFPLLIEFLVKDFGFHGTILLLGGCMLHVCVSATLYRPLDENYAPEENVSVEKFEKELKEQVESRIQLIYPLLDINIYYYVHCSYSSIFSSYKIVNVLVFPFFSCKLTRNNKSISIVTNQWQFMTHRLSFFHRIRTSRSNRNWNCYSPTIQLPDTTCWTSYFIRTAAW